MQFALRKHLSEEVHITWKGSFYNNSNSFSSFSKPMFLMFDEREFIYC